TGRRGRLLAAGFVLAGGLTAIAPGMASAATAAPCVAMTGVPLARPSTGGSGLYGVAVRGPWDASALGVARSARGSQAPSLILHWDGARWTQVPSPNPGSVQDLLFGVAATSASNAWAVGFSESGGADSDQTLIERWDGSSWTQVPSPNPGTQNRLF